MKIVQITDIHINKLFELTNNINVQSNFITVLDNAMLEQPELLVLSGDLGHNEVQVDVYQWIKSEMDSRGVPYRVIGGNHDDVDKLTQVYAEIQGESPYFSLQMEGYKFLFLNTIDGKLDEIQFNWFKSEIKTGIDAIFMHHPPLLAGVPHMDGRYAMQERQPFLEVIQAVGSRHRIFSGHYHTERTLEYGNISVYITPSTIVQISDKSEVFTADHYKPGYRVIEFHEDGFRTWVRYIWN